jgi:hypothetical protein
MRRQLKVALLALVLAAAGLFNTGCLTLLGPGPGESVSYHAGRDVTVAYLLGKDKLEEKHKQAVKTTYEVFKEVMDSVETKNLDVFKDTLKAALRKRVKDDKAYALSIYLLDKYWARLTAKVDWTAIQDDERIKVLTDFKTGVEDSLEEYAFLL